MQKQGRLLRQPLGNDQIVPDPSVEDPTAESNSVLDYLQTVQQFMGHKANAIAAARRKLGLPEGWTKKEKGTLRGAKGKTGLSPRFVQSDADNEKQRRQSKKRLIVQQRYQKPRYRPLFKPASRNTRKRRRSQATLSGPWLLNPLESPAHK